MAEWSERAYLQLRVGLRQGGERAWADATVKRFGVPDILGKDRPLLTSSSSTTDCENGNSLQSSLSFGLQSLRMAFQAVQQQQFPRECCIESVKPPSV